MGQVRNKKTLKLLKGNIVHGYVRVQLAKGAKHELVHRLVMEAFVGVATGLDVDHINGVRSDNRLENLQYLTESANTMKSKKNWDRPNKWDPILETYI